MNIKSDCPNHRPVQHRDGKPPWCNKCGLTAGGTKPISRLERVEPAAEDEDDDLI